MTVTEARASLPAIIDRVSGGEQVILTRHGQPVAVVVGPDSGYNPRAAQAFAGAADVRRLLEEARHKPRPAVGLSAEEAEDLIRWVDQGRGRRW